jgi:hypothetical protein
MYVRPNNCFHKFYGIKNPSPEKCQFSSYLVVALTHRNNNIVYINNNIVYINNNIVYINNNIVHINNNIVHINNNIVYINH